MSSSTDDLPANPYPPSSGKLEDKPGYPYNTQPGRPTPNIRYEAPRMDKGQKNLGHGHVYPRADGVKARCGGARMCPECARDHVERYGSKLDTGSTLSDASQLGTFEPSSTPPPRPGTMLRPDGALEPFTPETGQNSARRMLERLAIDEPVFVLRGNDVSAALHVRNWISLQELNPNPPWAKIRKARQILAMMEAWHRDGKTKWPD